MECNNQNISTMSENESMYGTTLSQESIKVIAESIGVGNFPDEAAKDLAEDVSYRLKEIIQVSSKQYQISYIIVVIDNINEMLRVKRINSNKDQF